MRLFITTVITGASLVTPHLFAVVMVLAVPPVIRIRNMLMAMTMTPGATTPATVCYPYALMYNARKGVVNANYS